MPLKNKIDEAAGQRGKGLLAADRKTDLTETGPLKRDCRKLPTGSLYDQF